MKRFLGKIGRFFRSRGFLKLVLWTITLIILFYAEEDWRGAHAWAVTKAKWNARGETFDYSRLIRPSVPNDQNMAAIPLFRQEQELLSHGNTAHYPTALKRALREGLPGSELPINGRGDWTRNALPDLKQLRQAIWVNYRAAFPDAVPSVDALSQFESLYPCLDTLRAATASRPLCQFPLEDISTPLFARSLGEVAYQIKLSHVLAMHAFLALDDHRPDLALSDIETNARLTLGVSQEPQLIAGLVSLSMNAIGTAPIYDGLASRQWNDDQLRKLEDVLEPIDFLATRQLAFRLEVLDLASVVDFIKDGNRRSLVGLLQTGKFPPPWTYLLWPDGWLDQNKSQTTEFFFSSLAEVVPGEHRIFPEITDRREQALRSLASDHNRYMPWSQLFLYALPASYISQTLKFAQAQVWLDETRLACALERYRLAHQVYPLSLDRLAPDFIAALPHDVINGESYHYRLKPDGTLLLYSVGWNEKDDGGLAVYGLVRPGEADSSHIENEKGDWVWPPVKMRPPR